MVVVYVEMTTYHIGVYLSHRTFPLEKLCVLRHALRPMILPAGHFPWRDYVANDDDPRTGFWVDKEPWY